MTSLVSRSALRPFDVLEAFRKAGRPLSLSEISQMANIPLSTCHGVLRSLEHYGLLYFLSGRESYPTRKIWDMAREINANDPIAARCLPALTSLRDATNETVILGTRQDDQVLYLEVIESKQTIRYSSQAGDYKPLHSSAIGKTLLSAMPEPELHDWVMNHELSQATSNTITTPRKLLEDLNVSRQRGYTMTRGENVADVLAVATPLSCGGMTLGVAVAGPLNRMEQHIDHITQELQSCVEGIQL